MTAHTANRRNTAFWRGRLAFRNEALALLASMTGGVFPIAAALVPIGHVNSGGFASGVAVSGDHAYVANISDGLCLYDISNPANPIQVAVGNSGVPARSVALAGSHAFVANGPDGWTIYNVSNPGNPSEVIRINDGGFTHDIAVAGGYVYLANALGGLRVYDVSIPSSPILAALFNHSAAFGVALSGEHVYLANGDDGLRIYDFSNQANPVAVAHTNDGCCAQTIAVSGNRAYLGNRTSSDVNGSSRLSIYDVFNPTNPARIGQLHTSNSVLGIALSGTNVFLANDGAGLRMLDVSDPAKPRELSGINNGCCAQDVAVAGDYVYLANGSDGLRVYQLWNEAAVQAPTIIQHPQSHTVPPETTITLSVLAVGNPPPAYQWRLNGLNIPGATSSTLVLSNAFPASGGSYDVVVVNSVGVAISEIATVIVTSPAVTFADNLSARGTIAGGAGTVSGSNMGATREPGETSHVGVAGGRSVWVAWVAPNSGLATFSTRGSTFDTLLAVYVGSGINALTNVAGDEDKGGFYTSSLSFNAVAGTEYLIVVDGFAGASGDIVLKWSTPIFLRPFQIVAQPLSQTVTVGGDASFSIVVTSRTPVVYQWDFDGVDIPGATNTTLVVSNVQPADVGHYSVTVRSDFNMDLSRAAGLEIGPDPQVLSRDKVEDLSPATVGAPGILSVSVGTIGAQLFSNKGAGTQTLEPSHCGVLGGASKYLDLKSENDGVIVIDTTGSEIDTVLAVYHRVGLASLSTNLVACDNDGALDGIRSQVRFGAVSGRTYRAFVDGVRGEQGFIALHWKMGLPPAFAPDTTNRFTVRQGARLILEAGTPGTFPVTQYQWLHNGATVNGATNATLVLSSIPGNAGGIYDVMAHNEFGTSTKTVAEITVEIPYLTFQALPTSGMMRLEFPAGQTLLLERSSDLVDWIPLRTNAGSGQAFFLDVTTRNERQGFYRARPLN